MDELDTTLENRVLVMQIITGALVMGVVMFAAIVTLGLGALLEPPSGQFLALFGIGFAGLLFFAHLMVPRLVTQAALRRATDAPTTTQLAGFWQAETIIALALLEGGAFFNLIALLIEHNWWSLTVSSGLLLWMLAQFPTRTRARHWIETQQMQRG